VTDRPIIFHAVSIRALAASRKSQTRRVLKLPKVGSLCIEHGRPYAQDSDGVYRPVKAPYAVGDKLWVREGLHLNRQLNLWFYRADGQLVTLPHGDLRIPEMVAWAHHKEGDACSSIHMPRWASRWTLTVTAVKVERLQEISEADAEAEGVEPILVPPDGGSCPHVEGYRELWNHLHGPGAWEANPWVAAISFEARKGNIDSGENR